MIRDNINMNAYLFKALADSFGKNILEDLDSITNGCQINGLSTLVSNPEGEKQNEAYKVISEVWDSHHTVGMWDSSFEGYKYCKIKEGIWVKIPYTMTWEAKCSK